MSSKLTVRFRASTIPRPGRSTVSTTEMLRARSKNIPNANGGRHVDVTWTRVANKIPTGPSKKQYGGFVFF